MNNKVKKFERKTIIVDGIERVNVGGKWVPKHMEQTAIRLSNITEQDVLDSVERSKNAIYIKRTSIF